MLVFKTRKPDRQVCVCVYARARIVFCDQIAEFTEHSKQLLWGKWRNLKYACEDTNKTKSLKDQINILKTAMLDWSIARW